MTLLALALLAVLPALVITAGLTDLTSMKIPNWISGLLILGFFPAALVVGLNPTQVAVHVGVGLAALFVGAAMFALRWLGGGDAKLLASGCLWFGLAGSPMFLLWTCVIGGLFCLVLMLARQWVAPFVAIGPGWIGRLMEPKGDIPYGVAIAIGALMAFPHSPLVAAFSAG